MATSHADRKLARTIWRVSLGFLLTLSVLVGVVCVAGLVRPIDCSLGTYPQGSRLIFRATRVEMSLQINYRDTSLPHLQFMTNGRWHTLTVLVTPDIGNSGLNWLYVGALVPPGLVCLTSAIIAFITGLLLRRSLRTTGDGHCPTCGYDLCATPDRCPECGTTPRPVSAAVARDKLDSGTDGRE